MLQSAHQSDDGIYNIVCSRVTMSRKTENNAKIYFKLKTENYLKTI